METITITVSKNGKATVAPSGFPGQSCATATAAIEAALGLTTSDVPTAEAYETPLEQTRELSR